MSTTAHHDHKSAGHPPTAAADTELSSDKRAGETPNDSTSEPNPARSYGTGARTAFLTRWFGRAIPTTLVMITLAGLGYWGHHSGWKIPKFSELTGHGQIQQVAWCDEHGVPEKDCIACNADLMPKDKLHGWCMEHGVAECVLEHPEIAQLKETPAVSQADLDRARRALAIKPRKKNDPACKLHLRRIQFPSITAVEKAGVDIDLVDRGAIVEAISITGEVRYDPTRVSHPSSRASGTVWRVDKSVGDRVRQGEVLALVDAADVGRTKADLLQANAQLDLRQKTLERLSGLGDAVAGSRVQEAETARAEADVAVQRAIQMLVNLGLPITYEEVRQTPTDQLARKIQFLGLPASMAQEFDAVQTTSNLIPIVAPREGLIVARDVVANKVVDTATTLFTVADTNQMWLVVNVPLEEAKHVAVGQKVIFRPDGAEQADKGTLTWISTDVDTQTRTIEVRAELPNDDSHLRNETFGAGEIVLREEQDAIVVPKQAVHWEGCCHVVFVRDRNFLKKDSYKVFHTRMVRPGVTSGDYTEMIAGVLPGEVVVTEGSDVLRAELLKGNLGAG